MDTPVGHFCRTVVAMHKAIINDQSLSLLNKVAFQNHIANFWPTDLKVAVVLSLQLYLALSS